MPTRRLFLAGAAGVSLCSPALLSAPGSCSPALSSAGTDVAALPAATPTPAPTPTPPPSTLATELARSVQHALPKAKLSDELTVKIAHDIDGNFSATRTFRAATLKNWQEPIFYDPDGQCDAAPLEAEDEFVVIQQDKIAFASLDLLAGMLRDRTISSVELTKYFLTRLEKFGPRLNAVATLLHERALASAKRADAELAKGIDRGTLHGIPYGVKDLLAAKGGPTQWGAQPYRNQTFDYDATVVARLEAAGAVLVAKLAMIELAGGMGYNQADASYLGPCRNPWNTDYWTGGSSSGPGAAVAAGLVPFAIGSETSGSIINPSSYCGITGLRPTYGRVSRHGAMALSWTLDKIGPMCRSARDASTVINLIAGHDPADATSSRCRLPLVARENPSYRLGVIKGSTKKVQPEVAKNFHAALATFNDTGAHVEEVALPNYPYGDMIGSVIAAEGAAAFRDIIQDGRVQTLKDPDGRRGGYSSLVTYAVDYVDAMRLRENVRQAFAKLLARYDALVTPSFSTVALPIGVPFDKAYPGTDDGLVIPACNLAGIPAVTVPNGVGKHGLPTGFSFIGRAFGEAEILALAGAYQARTSFHRKRPPFAPA